MSKSFVIAALATILSAPAFAQIDIVIDKRTQTMTVAEDGDPIAYWPVSTARQGYYTPTGHFRPQSMQPMHYSKKYDNAPMPHSIFFSGGYAIHATPHLSNLGRPASHGCVRLAPEHAAHLYRIVGENLYDTNITIQ